MKHLVHFAIAGLFLSHRGAKQMSTVKKSKVSKKATHANAQRTGRIWIACLVVVLAIFGFIAIYKRSTPVQAKLPDVRTVATNEGVGGGAGSADSTKDSEASMKTVAFEATVPNTMPRPEKTPQGMVWISGGEFSMGAQNPPDMDDVGMKATKDSRPVHRVYVDGFFMDKTDVTNAEFERFVTATKYVTVAERKPRAEDYPGAPPENLVAGSVVFAPPKHPVSLDN